MLLIMAVGAQRSETFVDRYRNLLPPCWAVYVGQAVKAAFGIVQRAPYWTRLMHAEWLWRAADEPGRLVPRYFRASLGFVAATVEDIWKSPADS
jgi:N-acetylglucosaminyldiphosphoundecaprenol N-acetyl-beta-D-mannosaminyltransferase